MNYSDYDDLLYTLDSSSTSVRAKAEPLYPKFQGMFWILAEALLITILGFRCLEKGNKVSRILALIGLGFGAVSIILQLLLVFEAFPYMESLGRYSYGLSVMGKITSFTTMTMVAAIAGALVMRIKEGEKMVGFLKMAAVFSGLGVWIIGTIMIFASDFKYAMKIFNLEGVFFACFVVSCITAWVLSRMHQKDGEDGISEKRVMTIEEVIDPAPVEPVVQVGMAQVEVTQAEPAPAGFTQLEPIPVEPTPVGFAQFEPASAEPAPAELNQFEPSPVESEREPLAPMQEMGNEPLTPMQEADNTPPAPMQEDNAMQQGMPPELNF